METEEKTVRKPRATKKNFLFNEDLYASEDFYANHKIKCKLRAARSYGVTIEHLEKAYFDLNGKKLDGFYITDLIDRFGFSDGRALNRTQLSEKYGYGHGPVVVDVAENKLRSILQNENVKKAYADSLRELKDEFIQDTNNKALYGE